MKKFKSGFTLIELLVVISIIGILAALALSSFSTAQKQAKDAERKSDLKQYQNSLEIFANKNGGLYPSRTASTTASTTLCTTDLGLTGCPEDPKNSTDSVNYTYRYISDGTNGTVSASKYVLWDKLESSVVYWVVCSNGKSGTLATLTPSAVCPLP
jgi:general secretion pathway protein G